MLRFGHLCWRIRMRKLWSNLHLLWSRKVALLLCFRQSWDTVSCMWTLKNCTLSLQMVLALTLGRSYESFCFQFHEFILKLWNSKQRERTVHLRRRQNKGRKKPMLLEATRQPQKCFISSEMRKNCLTISAFWKWNIGKQALLNLHDLFRRLSGTLAAILSFLALV